ncbi:site-specific integrase [Burkholderia vietnamiensis]|uniref:site-specific integrase n=1 Tax=Burkholderia vietnamiensis TaxID=60552 RepID=UPI001CF1832E|nr:site-specific integrase [Burkholderia vietnamiensis]MCA8393934.1 site-specific integrase [Burkholderia vietnamiensis]HDR8961665.1 site-specific integrase [Burkholderia vietnamiensis]HDR9244691.1 site-specific integrase [Burkholderia vietnamiensis]
MTKATRMASEPTLILNQPHHVIGLSASDRDLLIVSMRKIGGTWVIVSRYGEDIWWLTSTRTNVVKAAKKLDFVAIPQDFRSVAKAVMYRLMRRGRIGQKRLAAATLHQTLESLRLFFGYLQGLGISNLTNVSPLACTNYAQTRKARSGRPLAPSTLARRLVAVETLYELSQYTDTPIPEHPWPHSTAALLANDKKGRDGSTKKTPLIPDEVFAILFKSAWEVIQGADRLLDLREEMARIATRSTNVSRWTLRERRNERLRELGFEGGFGQLRSSLLDIRTAAYIVVASLSGCRNHELAFLRTNAYYTTEDNDGERYWWMRSKSTKTDEGAAEWMIPEVAVTALQVMERWSAPYHVILRHEIACLRAVDPLDLRIGEAEEHLDALFVGKDSAKGNLVRTLGLAALNEQLRAFADRLGLSWELASHQFRRKFANYAARSQFGDLRYLKQHFKHWSIDMTLGYALNESQEMTLYFEIEDELDELKEEVVSGWLDSSTPLAGGYGKSIMDWRSRDESVVLFKSHAHMVKSIAHSTAIRSNGHAWCTADDNRCVGNTLERTRCAGGCSSAVIAPQHAFIYQGLRDHLATLLDADDIGKGGRARVQRDLDRCTDVLQSLLY